MDRGQLCAGTGSRIKLSGHFLALTLHELGSMSPPLISLMEQMARCRYFLMTFWVLVPNTLLAYFLSKPFSIFFVGNSG